MIEKRAGRIDAVDFPWNTEKLWMDIERACRAESVGEQYIEIARGTFDEIVGWELDRGLDPEDLVRVLLTRAFIATMERELVLRAAGLVS